MRDDGVRRSPRLHVARYLQSIATWEYAEVSPIDRDEARWFPYSGEPQTIGNLPTDVVADAGWDGWELVSRALLRDGASLFTLKRSIPD